VPSVSFATPTIAALRTRIATDLNSRWPSIDARVPRSVPWVLVWVMTIVAYPLHRLALKLSDQILPTTAGGQFLADHATIHGLTRVAAVAATGTVTPTGVATTVIPISTELVTGDGTAYTTDAGGTVGGGAIAITASVAGVGGNVDAATVLTFSTPIVDVDSTVAVDAGGTTGGADEETDTALRSRLLEHIGNPPQGGSDADYVAWTKEATADVTAVFVDSPPTTTPGEVDVWPVVTVASGGPIPSAGQLATVQTYIDARRPVTAAVTAKALVAIDVDIVMTVPVYTAALDAALQAEVEAMLLREGGPGVTIPNSTLRAALSQTAGETSHVITSITVDSVGVGATGDIAAAAGEFAVLNIFTVT